MLDTVVSISSVIGSLSLVASVLLLLRELRDTNRLARAANAQTLVEMAAPFYLGMVQDRQMAELCAGGARDFTALDEVDQSRYLRFLVWWLIFYENIFYQRRQRLLDQHTFQPWWCDFRLFAADQNLSRHWLELEPLFQQEFAEEVRTLLAEIRGEPPPAL